MERNAVEFLNEKYEQKRVVLWKRCFKPEEVSPKWQYVAKHLPCIRAAKFLLIVAVKILVFVILNVSKKWYLVAEWVGR